MSSDRHTAPDASAHVISTAHGDLVFGRRCLVMGILNVTPDSFSDGGLYDSPEKAAGRAVEMARQGADVIDVGGESTRPGSKAVSEDGQRARVIPAIQAIREAGIRLPLAIDTRSSQVAEAALGAGADIVNDISAGRADAEMLAMVARRGAPVILMHMQGTPETMQEAPHYADVFADVRRFLDERIAQAVRAGVDGGRILVDPGIGFGKSADHNLTLLRRIHQFVGTQPLLVGASRKRFIGSFFKPPDPEDKPAPVNPDRHNIEAGSALVVLHCALSGVGMVRVHDVARTRVIVEAIR